MIMMRTLRRDLNRYNSVEEKEELADESGWKLVHGDVLRPPPLPLLLSSSVGTGMQLLFMAIISIFCAMLGFLSPANRGGLLTATLLLFVLMGVPAGYYGSLLYKSIKGSQWKSLTASTALLYPGVIFLLFFCLNLFMWGCGSSAAVPFTTMLALICMWFCISVPLVFLGAFFGFQTTLPEPPVRTRSRSHAKDCRMQVLTTALSLPHRCARTRSHAMYRCRRGTWGCRARWRWAASCRSAPCSLSSSST